MAALTAEERAESQAVFEEYDPPGEEQDWEREGAQHHAVWQQRTPLQVVRQAFDLIKANLSSIAVRKAFHKYLRLQEQDIRHYYNEPETQDHPLADGDMIAQGGTQEDQNKLDRAIYNILVGEGAPAAPQEVEMNVKQSELELDLFAQDDFTQGQRVIRIGGDNRFIFDREGLLHVWRTKGFRFNPLIGVVPLAPDTQIEYGVLNILPDGGRRRRKTKKSKRRARTTRVLGTRKSRRSV